MSDIIECKGVNCTNKEVHSFECAIEYGLATTPELTIAEIEALRYPLPVPDWLYRYSHVLESYLKTKLLKSVQRTHIIKQKPSYSVS